MVRCAGPRSWFAQAFPCREARVSEQRYAAADQLDNWRRRADLLKPHGLNVVRPWFLGLSAAARKLLLDDPYKLHTPDVLHSFKRVMLDLALGVVHMCLAWRQRGKKDVYSHRIAKQHRFRPHGQPALRTFPQVCSQPQ